MRKGKLKLEKQTNRQKNPKPKTSKQKPKSNKQKPLNKQKPHHLSPQTTPYLLLKKKHSEDF